MPKAPPNRAQKQAIPRRAPRQARHDRKSLPGGVDLEAIYRTAPVGLGVLDRDLNFVRVNDRLAEINGLPADLHVGRSVREVVPALEGQARAALARIIETGKPLLNLEFRGQTPAQPGVERFWNVSWVPLCDDGELAGINLVVHEITEDKKADQEIRRANAYNRSLIEASLDPLVTIGPDGKITDVNAATSAVTGYSRSELIGQDFSDYFTEPDKARAGYQRVFQLGELHDYPLEILHRDGHVTPVLYTASVYRDAAGQAVGVFAAARDMTQIRRAEIKVRAERQRLYDVLETLPAYAILLTADYRVPFANRFFRERFGESKGRRCYEYLFGRDTPCENCETYRVLTTNQPQRWEWLGPDRRNYDIHDFPFVDSDGSSLILEIGIDITEQKQAEAKLLRYQEHLQDLVEERTRELANANSQLSAEIAERERAEEAILRQNIVLENINRIFEMAMQAVSEQQLGEACLELAEKLTGSQFGFIGEIGPDGFLHDLAISNPGWAACTMYDQTGHRKPPGNFEVHGIYGRVLLDGKSLIANDPASHPDRIGMPAGHPPLTAFLGVPLLQEGKVVGMIAVGNREGGYRPQDQQALELLAPAIIEALARVRVEAARRRLSEALGERVAELETLMEVAPVGIAIGHDPDCRVITANRMLGEWLAAPPGTNVSLSPPEEEREASYQVFRDGRRVGAEDLPAQYAALNATGMRDGEFRVVRADGSSIDLMANAEPLLDAQRRVRGAVATFIDITAMKQSERERAGLLEREQAARSEAEAAVRTRDHFIALASHELKTPLTSLRGYAELLMQRASDPSEEDARMMRTIHQQTLRLEKMISALLDISRIERGQLTLERAPVNLGTLLADAVRDIQPTLRVHTLEFQSPDEPVVVDGDEGRLEQVLQNLILNAVKYSPAGGPVLIRLSRTQHMARITVQDQGIGIPAAALPQLFTRFYRAENAEANHISGLGIGLYVAREIVHLHHGEVGVESEEGKGSTFAVTLPLIRVEA